MPSDFDGALKRVREVVTSISQAHRLDVERARRECKTKIDEVRRECREKIEREREEAKADADAKAAAVHTRAFERGRRDAAEAIADALLVPHRGSRESVDSIVSKIKKAVVMSDGRKVSSAVSAPYESAVMAAASAIGVDVTTMARRSAPVVMVRWSVWRALRDLGYSYPSIARCPVLGIATHGSVMHALATASEWSARSREGAAFLAATAAARAALISAGIGDQHKETA